MTTDNQADRRNHWLALLEFNLHPRTTDRTAADDWDALLATPRCPTRARTLTGRDRCVLDIYHAVDHQFEEQT